MKRSSTTSRPACPPQSNRTACERRCLTGRRRVPAFSPEYVEGEPPLAPAPSSLAPLSLLYPGMKGSRKEKGWVSAETLGPKTLGPCGLEHCLEHLPPNMGLSPPRPVPRSIERK